MPHTRALLSTTAAEPPTIRKPYRSVNCASTFDQVKPNVEWRTLA
ncbi:MAG: hypothetical protein ABEI11_03030 [Haloarculaceae archaeon]